MSKPKILIVGCGAVGLTEGYLLSFGAEITYLVRPGRKPTFQAPKKLYDYKENALRVFNNYRVIESTSEVAGEEFHFVFDTLDGHTACSGGGVATLKAVGDLIRHHPSTFVVYDAIGLDMQDHYATTMGIAPKRLILGASILAHQPTKTISLPATADAELAAQADMLYSYGLGNAGLIVFNSQPKLTKAIGEVFSKHPKLHIQVLPGWVGSSGILLGMVQLMAWSIDDFPPSNQFVQNTETWNLLLNAQTEILTLPRFGWTGWAVSWFVGSWVTRKMVAMAIEGALPMQMHEFNAFHHGSKVVRQDLLVLEEIVREGEKGKHKMPALNEVYRRAEEAAERRARSE